MSPNAAIAVTIVTSVVASPPLLVQPDLHPLGLEVTGPGTGFAGDAAEPSVAGATGFAGDAAEPSVATGGATSLVGVQ
jgi:hypothetical protein